MSTRFSQRRRLHRQGCVIGLFIGALGGIWMAMVAQAKEVGNPCADSSVRCEQRISLPSSIQAWVNGSYSEVISLLLLGGGVGSLAGLAIAPHVQRNPAPWESQSSTPLPPSAPIDLSQFTSSAMPLTRRQRETLQCLWLMAAIAPSTYGSSYEPSSCSTVHPTSSIWEWCIRQIQQSAIARDDLTRILTQMGFSSQTVQTAWRIAEAFQFEAAHHDSPSHHERTVMK